MQGTGKHKHKCCNCGNVWEHADTCMNNRQEHTCSNCGNVVWTQFHDGMSCADIARTERLVGRLEALAALLGVPVE